LDCQCKISQSALDNLTAWHYYEKLYDQLYEHLIFHFETSLAGNTTQQYFYDHVHVPATAWQHFKRDYLPIWFSNLFPVRTKEIVCKTEIINNWICPHISLPEKDEAHFRFIESKGGLNDN